MPTIGEFFPGYEVNIWLGIWAPAGTPEPVISRLHAEINRVLALPEVGERIRARRRRGALDRHPAGIHAR